MPNNRDAALVSACLAGDRKAFEMLVGKYEKKLYNTALRIVGDREDAMDATQTAFVKAYEKLDTFDPNYRFFSWIYRILLNESLNIVNRRKRFEEIDSGVAYTLQNPESDYADNETGRHVQDALMRLKTDYRIVIVLKHFQDMSYREMSEVVGVSEKRIKSRLFTARRRLKEILLRKGIAR